MKYLKYYISTFTLILSIYIICLGPYYPTGFFIIFSLFIILGDYLLPEDVKIYKYSYPTLLYLPIYINLPILIFLITTVVAIIGNNSSGWLLSVYSFLKVDLLFLQTSITTIDKIFLIALVSLFIGIMATVPAHELVHRKGSKLNLFIGNWLLALSWDCAFAIEHVHGHHKNVCLPNDPASAKRGENIYGFILRATLNEHRDAWNIQINRNKKSRNPSYLINNDMVIGYLRSLFIVLISFLIGGTMGMVTFLICALIAKALLEVINYTEHYGLVRERGKPVFHRHSWNSNSVLSSLYLFNVTRHSSHHQKVNLKYWELDPYQDAPMMPQGYLSMLFLSLLIPPLFHKIMAKKLLDWDKVYATVGEKALGKIQNSKSGVSSLMRS